MWRAAAAIVCPWKFPEFKLGSDTELPGERRLDYGSHYVDNSHWYVRIIFLDYKVNDLLKCEEFYDDRSLKKIIFTWPVINKMFCNALYVTIC